MNLPLFPLDTVLFPGCMLDLQLFEPRYLDMVSACLKAGHGFGVVGILEGTEVGPAPTAHAMVGCEALIRDWQQRPNGLLGIRVEGARRFAVQATEVRRDQLLVAAVDWRDEPPPRALDEAHEDLLVLLQALGQHPMVKALGMPGEIRGQAELANQLAYLLPFDGQQKIELLDLDEPGERLALIQQWLERLQGEGAN
ncbi:LON peptidase substrate-binding domain-containing protein [Pseudomonas oligotrophica]|uniref:LON peptidase substrate-binding domain-containing protein n=1 Tax=Pseudomonas oligotrophica TaxID=2912055 RepID=UPI001F2A6BEC|nr:LON peptidase substrate-binding domain-containing protein [Pseudomonas oligotrophica]MCF7201143.1 LON peptidase substrate-binding domain-containing protein [Pseudomonas oligotrophica]